MFRLCIYFVLGIFVHVLSAILLKAEAISDLSFYLP